MKIMFSRLSVVARMRRFLLLSALLVSYVLSPTGAFAFTPQTGHWWNPNESGTGYNIDVNNGVLVMTIYSFSPNGDSQWYLAAGPMSPDQRSFAGTLEKYRNGQCISCVYAGQPSFAGNDGSIVVNFLSETSAKLTLPNGRTTTIQPFFPVLGGNTKLAGTYRLVRTTVSYLDGRYLETADGSFLASGTMVVSGNQLSQTVAVTVNGVTVAIGFGGTFVDYGPYIIFSANGTSKRATIVARGPLVITEAINPAIGSVPGYSEVDQWQLVSQSTAMEKTVGVAETSPSSMGGAIGELVKRLESNP